MKSGVIVGLILLHLIGVGYSWRMRPYAGEGGGSAIPECGNACGGCKPCKLVMVSYKCSVAESCPVVYRCMCHGKYFHVPSHA